MRRGSSELVAVHRIAGRSGSARSIRLARHLRPPRSRWPSRSPTPRSPGGAPERPRRPASWLRRHTGEGPDPHSEQRNCRREHRAVGSGDARGNRDGACGHRDSRAASACGSARAPPGVRTKFFLAYQLHTGMPAAGSKVRQSASERGHREVTRAAASEPRGARSTQRSRAVESRRRTGRRSRGSGQELRAGSALEISSVMDASPERLSGTGSPAAAAA
jgi:hypothetical protein